MHVAFPAEVATGGKHRGDAGIIVLAARVFTGNRFDVESNFSARAFTGSCTAAFSAHCAPNSFQRFRRNDGRRRKRSDERGKAGERGGGSARIEARSKRTNVSLACRNSFLRRASQFPCDLLSLAIIAPTNVDVAATRGTRRNM